MENYSTTTRVIDQSVVSALFKSTYLQMAAALTVTALTAFFLPYSGLFEMLFFTADGTFTMAPMWIAIIAEFAVVMWLSARLFSMSMAKATLLFILYSVLNGVTLSMIFLMFDIGSIAVTFAVTAGMFFVTSLIGYVTRMNLSKFGGVLMMLLVGIIIATVVNIFLGSEMVYWVTTYIGVIVFAGLAAFDTNKLKQIYIEHGEAGEMGQKLALMGALTLYLDFVNLFLFLLRIFGDRK
ncbi:MAG: Bax inhibitor-1/YccA family protein [Alistipes sp.]|nr:Bax inhibitor-1/YccA family protein [Alistipes sp.]